MEDEEMKEYDWVRLLVDKEEYAKEGAHKNMTGCIMEPQNSDGTWQVFFDVGGEAVEDWEVVDISIPEDDLELVESSAEDNRKDEDCTAE
jgi:hypothetical protein